MAIQQLKWHTDHPEAWVGGGGTDGREANVCCSGTAYQKQPAMHCIYTIGIDKSTTRSSITSVPGACMSSLNPQHSEGQQCSRP